MDRVQGTGKVRKRKAENQDNERLSKRLSLLNLERNGQKLYVPVEEPSSAAPRSAKSPRQQPPLDDSMQLDDTKHKVYIYDLDAELSDSESSDDGRLVFLPDIEKHLRETRIPPMVLANSEGELAGNKQLVLYNVPSSLTVPEGQDSVRKAIIETRARARARQEQARNEAIRVAQINGNSTSQSSNDWLKDGVNGLKPSPRIPPIIGSVNEEPGIGHPGSQEIFDNDPDAMDIG